MKRRRKRLQTVFIRLRMSRIGDLFRWLIRGRTRREISQLRSYEFHQLILKYDIQTLTFRGQMAAVHVKFQIVLRAYTMQARYRTHRLPISPNVLKKCFRALPKAIPQKCYKSGFRPSERVCPKDAKKVMLKWSKSGRGKICDHLNTTICDK